MKKYRLKDKNVKSQVFHAYGVDGVEYVTVTREGIETNVDLSIWVESGYVEEVVIEEVAIEEVIEIAEEVVKKEVKENGEIEEETKNGLKEEEKPVVVKTRRGRPKKINKMGG